jgi:hypothetical protein
MSRLLDTLTKQVDRDKAEAMEARGDAPAIDSLTRERDTAFDLPGLADHPVQAKRQEAPKSVLGGYALPSINGIAFGGQGVPGFDWKPDSLAEVYGPDPTHFIRRVKDDMEKLELEDRGLYDQLDKAHSVNSRRNIEKKLDASNIAWQRLAWLANPDIDGQPLTIQCRTQTTTGRCDGPLWRTEIAAQAGRCLGCINTLYNGRTV